MTAKTAFVFMLSNVLSEGHIEDIKTEFVKGKLVSTSHTTLQPYSKIECVKKCYEEGKKGNCNVAGYDKSTKSCHLSLDKDTDVVDVAAEAAGVYIFPQGNDGVFIKAICRVLSGFFSNSFMFFLHFCVEEYIQT